MNCAAGFQEHLRSSRNLPNVAGGRRFDLKPLDQKEPTSLCKEVALSLQCMAMRACSLVTSMDYLIAKVSSPAGSMPHVAQPAGEVPEETGRNALPVTPSTATECALLPVAS